MTCEDEGGLDRVRKFCVGQEDAAQCTYLVQRKWVFRDNSFTQERIMGNRPQGVLEGQSRKQSDKGK